MGSKTRTHNILTNMAWHTVKTTGDGHGRSAYAWNKHEEVQKEFHERSIELGLSDFS